MSEDQRAALGPAGETLARNVERIRKGQRLTFVALADRLAEIGRPIPVLGLRRIERAERRVDADDLLALAYAFGVPPVDLLVPGSAADDEPFSIAPTVTTTAVLARDWIAGRGILPSTAAALAAAIRWMPPRRGKAVMHEWVRRNQHNDLDTIAAEGVATDAVYEELGYFTQKEGDKAE